MSNRAWRRRRNKYLHKYTNNYSKFQERMNAMISGIGMTQKEQERWLAITLFGKTQD